MYDCTCSSESNFVNMAKGSAKFKSQTYGNVYTDTQSQLGFDPKLYIVFEYDMTCKYTFVYVVICHTYINVMRVPLFCFR